MIHPSHLPVFAPCSTCGVMTVGSKHWYKTRGRLKIRGVRPRRGTECAACNRRNIRRAEALAEASPGEVRPRVSIEVVLAEWAHLSDPSLSIAENCRLLAPRLGMRWRTLERAVGRHRQETAA